MIVVPRTKQEWSTLAHFLQVHAGVQPSSDMQMIGWVSDDQVKIAVGFNGFLGKACQIHIAMEYGYTYTPKEMLRYVFNFAFNRANRELLIGVVNSESEEVLKYDLHLGFKELYRIPGMHDNAGDIVLLGMRRADCRYLPKVNGTALHDKELEA